MKKQKNAEVYVPAKECETPIVAQGEVYQHSQSGARKSSGSYYTKSFVVDHLLDGALKPALDDHFNRLDQLGDTDASDAFFDFRVADIAMGSGHFLISAIDMMEQRMADYLAVRHLAGVKNELAELRSISVATLRETGHDVPPKIVSFFGASSRDDAYMVWISIHLPSSLRDLLFGFTRLYLDYPYPFLIAH